MALGACLDDPALECPAGDGLGQWAATAGTDAPSHRYHHALIPVADGFLAWGGASPDGARGDGARYVASEDRWITLPAAGAPSARSEFAWAVTQDSAGHTLLVIFGGQDTGPTAPQESDDILGDGAVLDLDTASWIPLPSTGAPPPRYRASTAVNSTNHRVYLVGGLSHAGPLQDAYELDVTVAGYRWTPVPGALPLAVETDPRPFMASPMFLTLVPTPWSAAGLLVAVSGTGALGNPTPQARAASFLLPNGPWLMDDGFSAPPSRAGSTTVWAPSAGVALLYGGHNPQSDPGQDASSYVDDLFSYVPPLPDTSDPTNPARWAEGSNSWKRTCTTGTDGTCGVGGVSVPRAFHASVWTGDGMLVVGGIDPGSCGGGSFFEWSTLTWRRLTFAGTPPRMRLPGVTFSTQLGVMAFGGHRPSSLSQQPVAPSIWTP
jgi:hypothetical protein